MQALKLKLLILREYYHQLKDTINLKVYNDKNHQKKLKMIILMTKIIIKINHQNDLIDILIKDLLIHIWTRKNSHKIRTKNIKNGKEILKVI